MKTSKLLLAVLLAGGFGVASAGEIKGNSSDKNQVYPKESSALPFGAGAPGLRFSTDGGKSYSNSINLENGPVTRIRNKYGNRPINGNNPDLNVIGTNNPHYLTIKDVAPVLGWFYNPKLGQVWLEKRAHGTEIFSVRQMTEPKLPLAPKFGGLVIAKVPNLPAGTSVYFGEWAPREHAPGATSDDFLRNAQNRTTWYVGENPTKNTKGLADATYNLVGVSGHTPGLNDFYTGSVKATFGTKETGRLDGSINRREQTFNGVRITADRLNFDGATIDNERGTFFGGKGNVSGQFYGSGAEALAGYGTSEKGNGVAFGGRKQ